MRNSHHDVGSRQAVSGLVEQQVEGRLRGFGPVNVKFGSNTRFGLSECSWKELTAIVYSPSPSEQNGLSYLFE